MPKYFFLKWYILNFRFNLAHLPHMLPGLHTYNKAENIGSVWERPNLKWVLFCVNICTNYAPNLWPNLTLGRSNTSCNIILQIALLDTFAKFGSFFGEVAPCYIHVISSKGLRGGEIYFGAIIQKVRQNHLFWMAERRCQIL